MRDFRNIIFVLVIAIFILQIIVTKQESKIEDSSIKPLIGLSTFSLYDITKHIAQDSVELFMILPFGVDAHSYEPSPKQVAKLYNSDLVIYSGVGLEPWIDGFEFKQRSIDMSKNVKLRELGSDEEHSHEGHHHHTNEEHRYDPHYWLDIQNMIKMTNLITNELIKIIPSKKSVYDKNRDEYILMLNKLDDDYKKALSSCQNKMIIVNHNAFSYLAFKYGFYVEALSGLSPEAEPNAKSMMRLIEHVKEHDISTVFFESFVSDKAMKSIAKEAKVAVDVLQPLGNITADEAMQKLSYEDIMRKNLEKISEALKCK